MPAASFVDSLRSLLGPLRDAFLDVSCAGCGNPDGRLCAACAEALVRPRHDCIGCLRVTRDRRTCIPCRRHWHLESLIAASDYAEYRVASVIKAFKYGLDRSLAKRLAACLMRSAAGHLPERPLFVPVPLHPHRRRWRGFNHAALLAEASADVALMPFADVLVRTRDTGPQARAPGRAERLTAMRGVFRVADTHVVADRHIVLVDDVCTTGATLDGCACTLLESGAASVTGLVAARR